MRPNGVVVAAVAVLLACPVSVDAPPEATDAPVDPASGPETAAADPDEACERADPFPATLADHRGLFDQSGTIQFVAADGNTLTAFTERSSAFDPGSGPIVFIMHGVGRNAEGSLDRWRDAVEAAGALALAPEFPAELYPSSESYNLGVGIDGTPYGSSYDPTRWRDPNDYVYSEIEHLFEAVRAELGSTRCRYSIYGHSAGGQFVHRLLTFRPDARVDLAIAANSGWYTLPTPGEAGDAHFFMPYGLRGAPDHSTRLERLLGHRLVILLGEEDTVRDEDLRRTPEADFQGPHRSARGSFYFATAKALAGREGLEFAWTLQTVPGVGHRDAGMSRAATRIMFDR